MVTRKHNIFQLATVAVSEYPEHIQLLYVKASLEEVVVGCDVALLTARHMLSLWHSLYKDQMATEISDVQSQYHNNDTYSIMNMSDKDSGKCTFILEII